MTIDIIARAESRRADIQAQIALLEAEIDDRRGELQKMDLVIEYVRELQAEDEPPFPDAGYKPPPLYYPPERNPEFHPASENVPEPAQAGEAEADPAPNTPETANEIHRSPSTNDEASPEAGPQAQASHSQGTGAGTLAGREGRSEGEAASADLPTHSPETAPENPERSTIRPADPPRSEAAEGNEAEPTAPGPAAGKSVEPSGSAAPVTLKQLVAEAHAAHPDWTARQIAEEIGRPPTSVQTTLAIVRKEASQPAQEARTPAPAPKAPPSPSSPATAKPAGKALRFWLRNRFGEYLHENLACFTRVVDFYWSGTEADILALKRAHPKFNDLSERAAPVEQPAARGTM